MVALLLSVATLALVAPLVADALARRERVARARAAKRAHERALLRLALSLEDDAGLTEVVGSPVSEPETLTLAEEAAWHERRAKRLARRALAQGDWGWWREAMSHARLCTALLAQARGR